MLVSLSPNDEFSKFSFIKYSCQHATHEKFSKLFFFYPNLVIIVVYFEYGLKKKLHTYTLKALFLHRVCVSLKIARYILFEKPSST